MLLYQSATHIAYKDAFRAMHKKRFSSIDGIPVLVKDQSSSVPGPLVPVGSNCFLSVAGENKQGTGIVSSLIGLRTAAETTMSLSVIESHSSGREHAFDFFIPQHKLPARCQALAGRSVAVNIGELPVLAFVFAAFLRNKLPS